MERFAFKIDNAVRKNMFKLCRLCGMDHPSKQRIVSASAAADDDVELDMCRKILDCVGVRVTVTDRMPQLLCSQCADRINDIYEYRRMCTATQRQTRRLLGLPSDEVAAVQSTPAPSKKSHTNVANGGGSGRKASASGGSLPMVTIAASMSGSSGIGNDDDDDDDGNLLVPMAVAAQPKVQRAKKRVMAEAPPIQLALKVPKTELLDDDDAPTVWCRICRRGLPNQAALV